MDSKGLVIVAVGLPGAGKSRFHEKFLPDAVRCCESQRLDSPGFMPPQSSKKRKPNAKDAVVDLTAED